MKPQELKQRFVELRAEGKSYNAIAAEIHIAKSTCQAWEKEMGQAIAKLKRESLQGLYHEFYMTKEARIKRYGNTLAKIEQAIEDADLSEVPAEKLLDLKLRYMEVLQKEYVDTTPAMDISKAVDGQGILNAYVDLLNRVKAGEVSNEQATKESNILSNLLKAYELTELKERIETLESLVGTRE